MKKITCVLFDMDGVMIDTEPQYDIFWRQAAQKFNLNIPNFEKLIKGTTLPNILSTYFSAFTKEEVDKLEAELDVFEAHMEYPEIPGSVRFVEELKNNGIKVGLVTSSTDTKLAGVYREKHFDTLFDTIVSAARVTKGKPSPDCYLLAAEDLEVSPENCVVFEDAFAGIEAGQSAGMTVIGLSTTHSADKIAEKGIHVIPDFSGFTYNGLTALLT